jgi:hypothetical protein
VAFYDAAGHPDHRHNELFSAPRRGGVCSRQIGKAQTELKLLTPALSEGLVKVLFTIATQHPEVLLEVG